MVSQARLFFSGSMLERIFRRSQYAFSAASYNSGAALMRVALSRDRPYRLSLNSILPVAADIMWQLGVVPLQGVCLTVHFSLSQFSMIVPLRWLFCTIW